VPDAVEPALDVERLRVSYGRLMALSGVSLRALPGEVTAILGPNGAGKTTLLETAQGLRKATSGGIRVLGRDHRRLTRRHRARVGVMLQEGGLPPALTARQAITDRGRLYQRPHDTDQLLDALDLQGRADRRIRSLSSGEARRVAFALALVGRPELVYLDEPAAGLDPHGREVINALVLSLAAAGVAIVLTTHLRDDVERIADRVVILNRGAVVADGTVDHLTHQDHEAVTFTGPLHLDLVSLLLALPAGSSAREVHPGRYLVSTNAERVSPATLATITAWCAQHDVVARELSVGRQTLTDVYLRLTDAPGVAVTP
jgi:ABC-2 type transport system ATP-binding protein